MNDDGKSPPTASAGWPAASTEEPDKELDDLVAASRTTLGLWDNPIDDEDWNRA